MLPAPEPDEDGEGEEGDAGCRNVEEGKAPLLAATASCPDEGGGRGLALRRLGTETRGGESAGDGVGVGHDEERPRETAGEGRVPR